MSQPEGYPYAVTVRSPDHAVLCCLSGLSMYAQRAKDRDKGPRGTWHEDGSRVTFYFSTPDGLEMFIAKANQLLPRDTWFRESSAC
jgi:hypothetical protein